MHLDKAEQRMNEDEIMTKRRRRVKRIKVYLVIIFLVLTITPSVLAIISIRHVSQLNKRIDELYDKWDKFELTYMLKAEANSALAADDGQAEETVEPATLHFEYYEDDYTVPEDFRKVYLTFDDGPSIYTTQILDVLDTYGVKATFFVTGRQAQMHPEWYQEIVGRGHSIGMHSYTHVYSDIYENEESFCEDIGRIHDCIEFTTGVDSKLYRFPGGSSNSVSAVSMDTLCHKVNDMGYVYFDWNISSQDATSPSLRSSEIITNVVSGIGRYDECVVLMHDSAEKYSTVQALPSIIEQILAMDKTVILPLDETSVPVQHLSVK